MTAVNMVPLDETHVQEAANIVAKRYRRLRKSVPSLPPGHENPESFAADIRKLVLGGPGVAAVMGGRLVGFLTGMRISGSRVYVPERASAVDDDLGEPSRAAASAVDESGSQRPWGSRSILSVKEGLRTLIYRRMYEEMSKKWVAAGRFTHLVTQMAHDDEALDAWLRSSFAPIVIDAIRDLRGVRGEECTGVTVRRATADDIDDIDALIEAHERYMAKAPIFMPLLEVSSRADNLEWLSKPGNVLLLAYQGDEAVAYIKRQPHGNGTAYIVSGPKSTAITGAYTVEKARSGGIATALLRALIENAKEDGCERISVDFENYNILGSRFWLRHFTPVCYSFSRKVDERIAWANADRTRESIW